MKQLNSMRESTKTKYFNTIMDCHNQKQFNVNDMRSKHKVNRVLIQSMIELNILSLKKNVATWIAGPITQDMLREIFSRQKQLMRKYQAAQVLRDSGQYKIKPVPVAEPIPAIQPTPLNKAHEAPVQQATTTIDDRTLRNTFITGVVIGVLISLAIAAMW
jgi:hypothetical protein